MNFTADTGSLLLIAAQVLFMVLPITGLVVMANKSVGQERRQTPRLITMAAAISAFAILLVMFVLAGSLDGSILATANLSLRICECGRYLYLAPANGKLSSALGVPVGSAASSFLTADDSEKKFGSEV